MVPMVATGNWKRDQYLDYVQYPVTWTCELAMMSTGATNSEVNGGWRRKMWWSLRQGNLRLQGNNKFDVDEREERCMSAQNCCHDNQDEEPSRRIGRKKEKAKKV